MRDDDSQVPQESRKHIRGDSGAYRLIFIQLRSVPGGYITFPYMATFAIGDFQG
jgi:hypothetical protein